MSNRNKRAAIAKETLKIIEQGFYSNSHKEKISIKDKLDLAIKNTILYTPVMFEKVFLTRKEILNSWGKDFNTKIEVKNETTLNAAKRLTNEENYTNVLCLNFASAKNPGGGFLSGSGAQEESLARSSGLYPCIVQNEAYYNSNKRFRSCLYTDHMIFSPKVPVFKDDQGNLLDAPYMVSFITAPAVNVGAVKRNEPQKIKKVENIMRARINKILSIALIHHQDVLVLGAWGCGVFKNDPVAIADYFYDSLSGNGEFTNKFRKIIFAVLDKSNRGIFKAFKNRFN